MKRAVLAVTAALALGAVGALLSGPRAQPFPHAEHAGLFPTCLGCHAGAASGDTTRLFTVTAESCAECHDGAELEVVTWSPPRRELTNLAFEHGDHAEELAEAGEPTLDCAGCHAEAGAPPMDVRLAVVENCIGCHVPGEPHFATTADCTTCHLPLVRAVGLSDERIAELPRTPDHDDPDFVLEHGETARTDTCAICHARESCARCHLNADRVASIASLGPDLRIARLLADRPGEWPEPASHGRPEWAWAHGELARESVGTCANCHSQRSCEACHAGGGPAAVASLPRTSGDDPRGVRIADVRPPGHTADFATRHGTAAAAGLLQCSVCHTERQCADCHAGAERPRFHPAGFVLRHGPEAFSRDAECAACHSGEVFCRDCHSGLGLASEGRTGGAFHDAQPTWLLAHGLAARQDLESCTTCHEERSCLRCHSAKAGFRVSPHGPGFDPAHAADKSQQSCGICHLSLPEAARP